jgi:hypothetical protein
MADKKDRNAAVAAAEVTGRTLGRLAKALDSLQAQHPHLVTEIQQIFVTGFEQFAALASEAGARRAAAVKAGKAAFERAQQVAAAAPGTSKAGARVRKPKARVAAQATAATRTNAAQTRPPSSSRSRGATSAAKARSENHKTAPGTAARAASAAALTRRQAHASSQNKRQQARRDRKG